MNFSEIHRRLMNEAKDSLTKFRVWSDKRVEQEEKDGVPAEKRSYMDHKAAFEAWIKETNLPKAEADEVRDAINFRN